MKGTLTPEQSAQATAAVHAARAKFATQQDMAASLGISQATISLCLKGTMFLPARCVLKAEAITGVSRHLLRPDYYPVEAPNAPPAWTGVDQANARVSFQNVAVLQRDNNVGAAA